jgi:MFS family permease
MQLRKRIAFGNSYFFVICLMGSFAIFSSTMSKNPVLNPFATSLGTPNDLIGFVAAASTIPGILISLPAASLSDIAGRRKVLLFSAFIFASAPFLYLFVTTWWQLALVRFYHGFATAIFVPVTEATIAERFPTKRGERIGLLNSATGLGRTIAPVIGGLILTLTSNTYHIVYLSVGIAGATSFLLTFLLLTEKKQHPIEPIDPRKKTSKMFQGWHMVVHNKCILLVSFIQASQYYVFGAVEFFIVGYTINVAKLDPLLAGIILTIQIAAIIIARPILGRISDKKGRQLPIVIGALISMMFLFAVPFTTRFELMLLFILGYGLGFAAVVSSTSPLISELAPSNLVGSAMGFLCTTMDIGQTLGPIISGAILASTLSYVGLFSSLSILLLVSTIIFALSQIVQKKT